MIYAYCRVSTGRQADDGQSLDVQQRQIEGYAAMRDLSVDHYYVDRGVSGSKALIDRPQGAELLNVLQDGDTVICSKLDRLFRSALNALDVLDQFRKRNISLHCIDLGGDVTTDGVAKLVFQILAAVAESERDRIRERIRDVKADQRKRGNYLGGNRPLGYAVQDKQLVTDQSEQAHIQRIKELRASGQSLRAISQTMREQGFQVSHEGVKSILARA